MTPLEYSAGLKNIGAGAAEAGAWLLAWSPGGGCG